MRHAGPEDLDAVDDLLGRLRGIGELTERKPGTFYRRGAAFLHFHVDPSGVYADVKVNGLWERLRATTKAEQKLVVQSARRAMAPP